MTDFKTALMLPVRKLRLNDTNDKPKFTQLLIAKMDTTISVNSKFNDITTTEN